MTNPDRDQNVYIQIALWIEDNPEPPLDQEGRLLREYVSDFSASGFTVEEIAEGRRTYRRDYSYLKRSFAFLWDKCLQARSIRLNIASPLEAWSMFWTVKQSKPNGKGWNVAIHHSETTLGMVMEIYDKPSQATAERILKIIHAGGRNIFSTDNVAADRARFCQMYEAFDQRMTERETWETPVALLPESKNQVSQLVQSVAVSLRLKEKS